MTIDPYVCPSFKQEVDCSCIRTESSSILDIVDEVGLDYGLSWKWTGRPNHSIVARQWLYLLSESSLSYVYAVVLMLNVDDSSYLMVDEINCHRQNARDDEDGFRASRCEARGSARFIFDG
ncbi:hypothetical protein TIFTF001_050973 [Ficus carica]|uniref:Uncharacterized protein n=1 Tax=Ficus carica TaxID=3494 RepID=A0AA87Z6K4_FICCA|nr:hypothetical protein TIFTF001_050973 [Ficus carica]